MTYAPVQNRARYKNYQEYLEDETLSPDVNYRLLSSGELIEVASEDDINLIIAHALGLVLSQVENRALKRRVRTSSKELQVRPVGDKCVNRQPDLMVVRPEHLEIARQAILLDMEPPLFLAEVVSPGGESSDNYQRDYVWKRQQYEEMGVLEYWIIDPHLAKVTTLVLVEGKYKETVYSGRSQLTSAVFPSMTVIVQDLITGDL